MSDPRLPVEVDPWSDSRWSRVEREMFARLDTATGAEKRRERRSTALILAGLAAAAALAFFLRPAGALRSDRLRVTTTDGTSEVTVGESALTVAPRSLVLVSGDDDRGIDVVLDRGSVACEVAPRKGRPPFVVEAGGVRVRVIGTKFTVTRDGAATSVAVDHGTVEVTASGTVTVMHDGEHWPGPMATEPADPAPLVSTATSMEPGGLLPAAPHQSPSSAPIARPRATLKMRLRCVPLRRIHARCPLPRRRSRCRLPRSPRRRMRSSPLRESSERGPTTRRSSTVSWRRTARRGRRAPSSRWRASRPTAATARRPRAFSMTISRAPGPDRDAGGDHADRGGPCSRHRARRARRRPRLGVRVGCRPRALDLRCGVRSRERARARDLAALRARHGGGCGAGGQDAPSRYRDRSATERFGAVVREPSWLIGTFVGLAARTASPGLVEARVGLHASVWPALLGHRWGLLVEIEGGPGAASGSDSFTGTLSDAVLRLGIGMRVPLVEGVALEPSLGGAAHLLTLDGVVREDASRVLIRRVDPAFEPRAAVTFALLGGRLLLAPWVGLTVLGRWQRFLAHGDPVIETGPVGLEGALRVALALP